MKRSFTTAAATILTIASVMGIGGCQTVQEPDTSGKQGQKRLPGQGVVVTPAYSVLEEKFQTEIINIGLRRLGYEVRPAKELAYSIMHTSISQGGIDYTAVHWKRLHSEFYQNSGGDEKLERLGSVVDQVLQGYAVDKDTAEKYNIDSLKDLQDPAIAKLFDTNNNGQAELTGCNPGWGCELVIEHHLDEYGLRDSVEHNQGQYFALMANTLTRYRQGQPVIFYTWSPLWVTAVLEPGEEVTWLEVPYTSLPEAQGKATKEDTTAKGKNLGFAVDQQMVLANESFASNHQAARRFFQLVDIPREDISEQNLWMRPEEQGGRGESSPADIRRHAENWVEEHQEPFNRWLDKARQAAVTTDQQASH